MTAFRLSFFVAITLCTVAAQVTEQGTVDVPEQVAALVRPILDLRDQSIRACGRPGEPTRKECLTGAGYVSEQQRWQGVAVDIAKLGSQKTVASDEALVVLMCYYVGESGEHIGEVMDRGRRMLPYLRKYENHDPTIPGRSYPKSLLSSVDVKRDDFAGTIDAIKNGRKSE